MTDALTFPPELVERLRTAANVVVLTGAGISAESGIPTFREAQTGLWAQYDPQELATPQAFRRNPRLVWEWYAWRRALVGQAAPNAGHYALAELERRVPHFSLITQNVDGLHQQAGSGNVIELHGNIARVKCAAEDRVVDQWAETATPPPRCPQCGALLRPDVVWFGEMLPAAALERAFQVSGAADLFLTVGTSGIVQPAASLPLEAVEAGALVVEINPETTPLSPWMTFSLRGAAGRLLPDLLAAAWPPPA
ncbi:NAD-dependent protein deacylase [Candidatus Promineifilum breve]|uniref:NAD-dependent protein deacylase n=1 Tax=Candidatus Promineifilum breve TaxID=1806508 RepID=A0A160T0I6_9CHLR|nr:NAD-dependent deacylase [Candidatus Promineifilum breve]CUS02228.2 NAD-dependent protein deacylase [Candidatus Promineifilum breve]